MAFAASAGTASALPLVAIGAMPAPQARIDVVPIGLNVVPIGLNLVPIGLNLEHPITFAASANLVPADAMRLGATGLRGAAVAAVPEPSAARLAVVGLLLLAAWRRWRGISRGRPAAAG